MISIWFGSPHENRLTLFVSTFREWMSHKHPKPETLIKPFADGGIIRLTALFKTMSIVWLWLNSMKT
jgi:hypothetical protein